MISDTETICTDNVELPLEVNDISRPAVVTILKQPSRTETAIELEPGSDLNFNTISQYPRHKYDLVP